MTDLTDQDIVDALLLRARTAQERFAKDATQKRYDKAALAVGWAIMQPERNAEMAELAVETTGLGNVADKITKNHRKTLGLLRDISDVKTTGIIREDPENGITEIARPIGVVGCVVPSTNPIATPANNIINALKCGNAIILSPSPKGIAGCERLMEHIYAEFDKLGIDRDLVLMIPAPGTKAKTQRMLEVTDLVVVTGSQDNVRRAYSSGTPAIGVGAGNVTVIVDETADMQDAAEKIAASKTFDNATSCSSENALVVVDTIYDDFIAALADAGGALVKDERSIVANLWPDGKLSRHAIAKDADVLIDVLGLKGKVPDDTKFLVVPTAGIGKQHPLSGEKLSRVVALYRAADYNAAKALVSEILAYQGAGHSVGIHTTDVDRPVALGHEMPSCRVIVNQAHCFATGGSFTNGLPFSLSMGCGSWGGNSIDENLHWKHFMNITRVVRELPDSTPELDQIFGDYWASAGK
ncbi:MAG: aldehyde dehydrogenase family protein [Rhodobacteraceae bacterium]|nr:aldehyde dehydrogenase family protein [Paracoccaceae bacterium]